MKLRGISLALVMLGAGLIALPATAGTIVVGDRSAEFSQDGLDLSKPADAKTLLERIQDAAARACKSERTGSRLTTRAAEKQCLNDAVKQTVAAINNPMLTATLNGTAPATASLG